MKNCILGQQLGVKCHHKRHICEKNFVTIAKVINLSLYDCSVSVFTMTFSQQVGKAKSRRS